VGQSPSPCPSPSGTGERLYGGLLEGAADFFRRNRQVADAHADSVRHGGGDGRRDRGEWTLTDALDVIGTDRSPKGASRLRDAASRSESRTRPVSSCRRPALNPPSRRLPWPSLGYLSTSIAPRLQQRQAMVLPQRLPAAQDNNVHHAIPSHMASTLPCAAGHQERLGSQTSPLWMNCIGGGVLKAEMTAQAKDL
jgi:hypothetical protein